MILIEFVIFALIGVAAGLLGGLLGIGGGLITVPALLFTFHYFEFGSNYDMHVAIGTSIAAMVFTAASSAFAHDQKKGVYWNLFPPLGAGMAIGAMLGAFIAYSLSSTLLEMVFGFGIIIIGLYLLFTKENGVDDEIKIPHRTVLFLASVMIGTVSSILGIGGGLLLVPFLTFFGVPFHNAISTSAVTGFVIALTASISYFLFGFLKHQPNGYVYLPAFIVIGISSVLSAPFGTKLAYYLPPKILRTIFSIYLIAVGIWMI